MQPSSDPSTPSVPSGPERAAARLLTGLGAAERIVTTMAFLAMAGVMFADVLAREVTGSGIIWARQASVYLNVVVVMVGIGIASARADHLRPRFADGWLPTAWEPWIRRLQHLLIAAFCLAFAVVAFGVVGQTFALGERATVVDVPVWPVQAVVPAAFLVAAGRHVLYAVFLRLCPVRSEIIAREKAAEQAAEHARREP